MDDKACAPVCPAWLFQTVEKAEPFLKAATGDRSETGLGAVHCVACEERNRLPMKTAQVRGQIDILSQEHINKLPKCGSNVHSFLFCLAFNV